MTRCGCSCWYCRWSERVENQLHRHGWQRVFVLGCGVLMVGAVVMALVKG